jgi:hypothetical protein
MVRRGGTLPQKTQPVHHILVSGALRNGEGLTR